MAHPNKMEEREIFLHSAGATVRHHSPFADLPVLENSKELSAEFLAKWVSPFYMTALSHEDFHIAYAKVRNDCNIEIAKQLLGEFNWRPRIVGAYLAAIEQYLDLEHVIGNLLLRSDVCYAGRGYCLALATFNTQQSIAYLQTYLHYYLDQKDLWFDQSAAMSALAYLDKVNGTDLLRSFIPQWERFVSNKPYWDLPKSIEAFSETIESLSKLRTTPNT